jgi:hypothetical protein
LFLIRLERIKEGRRKKKGKGDGERVSEKETKKRN